MDKTVQQIADQETVNMKLRAEIDRLKRDLAEAYMELRQQHPTIGAVFNRAVWDKAESNLKQAEIDDTYWLITTHDLKESVRKVIKEYQFTRTSGFIPLIEWKSVKGFIDEINEVLDKEK